MGFAKLCWLFTFTITLQAAPVFVNNFSFETFNPLNSACVGANCAYNLTDIPGWTNNGDTGSFRPGNPSNVNYFDSIPNGAIIAYSNGGSISQQVGNITSDMKRPVNTHHRC